MKYEVETESGSRYVIDTDQKVLRRHRAAVSPAIPGIFAETLADDGQDLPYDALLAPLEVGGRIAARHHGTRLRLTTRITAVREVG